MSRLVRVASVGEIPVGRGKSVEVDGVPLAVYHVGSGQYQVLSGVCPHEGGPLGDGVLLGDSIVCPWHGFDFDLASGRCLVAPDLSISVYPVRVVGDVIEVDLS